MIIAPAYLDVIKITNFFGVATHANRRWLKDA